MGIHGWFNAGEALVWLGIAVTLFLRSRKKERDQRILGSIAAYSFALFGTTDVLEIFTGTWAEPVGLLLLNALCVFLLLACAFRYVQLRHRQD